MRRTHGLTLSVVATLAAATTAAGSVAGHPQGELLAPTARFACYSAQFGVFRPQTRSLVDQLSRFASVAVSIPETVCAPAPGTSTSYLTCYRVTVNSSKFGVVQTLRIFDEFAKAGLTVRVYRLLSLCAPSTRVDVAAQNQTAKGLDLFTCYLAKPTSSITYANVAVGDDFGKSNDTLTLPLRLCAPAAVKGSRQVDSTRLLACYTANSETKGTTVVVRNE